MTLAGPLTTIVSFSPSIVEVTGAPESFAAIDETLKSP